MINAIRTLFLTHRQLIQWAILDLNQRPFPYQRNALAG